jgi:hypothetical protein
MSSAFVPREKESTRTHTCIFKTKCTVVCNKNDDDIDIMKN